MVTEPAKNLGSKRKPRRAPFFAQNDLPEHFLRQSAYSETDASCPPEKAFLMLKAFLSFHTLCRDLLARKVSVETVLALPFREELERMKELPAGEFGETAGALIDRILKEGGGDR